MRDLLRSLGQTDERMALTHRYTDVMNRPMDLSIEGEAEKLVGIFRCSGVEISESAAWVAICNAVLNLDEFLTRE